MNDHVIRSIERLAVGLLGEHRERAVMFEADQPGSLGADLPAFEIKGVAVGFVGRFAKLLRNVAVIVEVTELAVGGNVAPHQILARGVPGRPFSPQTPRIQPLDDGIADLGLETLGVDDEDVRVGIALRFGSRAEIAGQGLRCGNRSCSKRGCTAQQAAAIETTSGGLGLRAGQIG